MYSQGCVTLKWAQNNITEDQEVLSVEKVVHIQCASPFLSSPVSSLYTFNKGLLEPQNLCKRKRE